MLSEVYLVNNFFDNNVFYSSYSSNNNIMLHTTKTYQYFLNIKIASLNCRGLNDDIKRDLLFDKFKNSDITIFCLQETKLNPKNEFKYSNEWNKGPSFYNSCFYL